MSWLWHVPGIIVWWMIFSIVSELLVLSLKPANIGRGYLTRMLARLPEIGSFFRGDPRKVMGPRLLLCLVIGMMVVIATQSDIVGGSVMYGLIVIFFIDDYYNGDDNWRKRWQEVRNRIKWKMKLPAPQPSRSGTS